MLGLRAGPRGVPGGVLRGREGGARPSPTPFRRLPDGHGQASRVTDGRQAALPRADARRRTGRSAWAGGPPHGAGGAHRRRGLNKQSEGRLVRRSAVFAGDGHLGRRPDRPVQGQSVLGGHGPVAAVRAQEATQGAPGDLAGVGVAGGLRQPQEDKGHSGVLLEAEARVLEAPQGVLRGQGITERPLVRVEEGPLGRPGQGLGPVKVGPVSGGLEGVEKGGDEARGVLQEDRLVRSRLVVPVRGQGL